MSVLKKVEEAYLGVLRLIIILAATLMLVATVVFLALAASNWKEVKPSATEVSIAVPPEDVAKGVLALGEKPTEASKKAGDPGKALADATPNKVELNRAAVAISNFVRKYGHGVYAVDADEVMTILKQRVKPYESTPDAKHFAEGLALSMEKVLSEPKVIKLVEPTIAQALAPVAVASAPEGEEIDEAPSPTQSRFKVSPIEVVNKALFDYVSTFEENVKKRDQASIDAIAEATQRKATAMTQLYMAGGIFGSFLFLVFISIVVKIERNLRALSLAPSVLRQENSGAAEKV